MSDKFDPSKYLRRLRGKGGDADYLDVKWRIVWLRHEHPEAIIVTEKMAGGMEANYAEFRAIVTIPGGGSATGYGSETKADFGDFIEKAETKALGRAIAALGYGTQFVGNELDEGERIVDSPVDRKRGMVTIEELGGDDDAAPQQATPPRASARRSDSPSGLRPAADTAAGSPYTKEEYEAAIKVAWQMQEAGDTYPAIVAYMRTLRGRLTPDQLEDSREEVRLIKSAIYPDVLAVG